MEIEYTIITAKKIGRNLFEATCNTVKPFKSEVNITGRTEDIAKEKLRLFLNNQPYKHLDDL